MPVHLTKEFLNDLRESRDARFVRQVLNHTIDQDGAFTADRDDHRYEGIRDAWIRYVTRGTTAYRVIFIRKGADVFLYRAGVHSVEDRLAPPIGVGDALQIRPVPAEQEAKAADAMQAGCLLKTTEATFIRRHIESMYHVKHNEISIVSPFIDLELLESRHGFGRFLDRAVEENTMVVVITSYEQDEKRLSTFKNLEERGICVYFLAGLHSKLYLFDVDLASRNNWQRGVQSHAIIGSSNLTNVGLGFGDGKCNEELNCRIPSELFDETRLYVSKLIRMADDYKKYAFKFRSRRPQ
jgi:phospholipase D-like protein